MMRIFGKLSKYMLIITIKEVKIIDEGSWGLPWASPKWAKTAKMANIDFFMEKSENGKDNDKALKEVMKIYAKMYGKGGHDY